jgi:hypothetical protein
LRSFLLIVGRVWVADLFPDLIVSDRIVLRHIDLVTVGVGDKTEVDSILTTMVNYVIPAACS